MTLWSGRVREGLAPEVWAFLLADDAELLAVRPRRHSAPRPAPARRRPARRRRARGGRADPGHDLAGDLLPTDEDIHSMIERLLGDVGRKIHAGRSRNDQVAAALRLYVEDACLEADSALRGWPRRPRTGRRGGRDADARLHASSTRAAGDGRAPPAGVGRDAGARSGPVLRGGRAGSTVAAGIGRAGRLDARAASSRPAAPELTRRRVGPRLRTRLPLRVRCLPLPSVPDRRRALHVVDDGVRVRHVARGGRHRLVDDAAEAEPRRGGARAREGGNGTRSSDRIARRREGAATLVQPGSPGGQGSRVRR